MYIGIDIGGTRIKVGRVTSEGRIEESRAVATPSSREEVQGVREKSDPIEMAKAELGGIGVSEDKLKDMDKAIRARVADAADFAESSPEPEAPELYTDVLVESY